MRKSNLSIKKTDAGYEGLGVDVLEQIRIQAKRRKVDYRVAKSVNDGIGAVITGKADIALSRLHRPEPLRPSERPGVDAGRTATQDL